MMTWLALKAINFYQKFISPYKGFNCAHRVATGEVGCSGYGKKVISRFGLIKGIQLLNRRFYDCGWHAKRLQEIMKEKKAIQYKRSTGYTMQNGRLVKQGGFVDCDCGGCDLPDCDMPKNCIPDCDCGSSKSLKAMDFCDCMPDDCGDKKKRHSPQFQEKRDNRNENKYNKKGVSLKKKDKDNDYDSDFGDSGGDGGGD